MFSSTHCYQFVFIFSGKKKRGSLGKFQLLANDVAYSFVLFLTQNVYFISSMPFTFGKARILQRGIPWFLSSQYSLGERCVKYITDILCVERLWGRVHVHEVVHRERVISSMNVYTNGGNPKKSWSTASVHKLSSGVLDVGWLGNLPWGSRA